MRSVIDQSEVRGVEEHPPRERPSTRKRWLFLLKAAISAALIYWVLRNAQLSEVAHAVRNVNGWLLLVSVCLYAATYYVRAVRWRILLRPHGVDPPLRFLLNSYFASIFFSNFLPSTIGGDALRGYDAWRAGASKAASVAVLLMDRVLGMVVLIAFALALLLVSPNLVGEVPHVRLWIGLLTLGMMGFLYLSFETRLRLPGWTTRAPARVPRKLRAAVDTAAGAFRAFHGRRDVLLHALVLSVVFQAATVVHYYLIAAALNLPIPLLAFFVIVPLAIIIMMLPVSINAIGLREGAFVFFFASYGVSTERAVAFAWLVYGTVLLLGLVGGVVYALRGETPTANS
ncbi:MAG: flippase-like domain-containing protein [Gemmatimonadetes bacterium]|nr:flippase-like domain-containing protein [Gemmatimonadota bacterium]